MSRAGWVLLGAVVVALVLLRVRGRREEARHAAAWDALARDFMLGFDAGSRSIRGKYRLLRLEITARRAALGLGPWRTRIAARYEGVVPPGLRLTGSGRKLRASARDAAALAAWLDAHGRREALPALLRNGSRVSEHTLELDRPGLLTDAEALRASLGELAELARLLSLR